MDATHLTPSIPLATSAAAATPARADGFVRGAPRLVLLAEGAVTLAAALAAYAHLGGGWGFFALLFLVPDVSMLGYLAGPRVGAAAYDAGHALVGPALLAAAALALHAHTALLVAVIWVAHVGFDRMLGYGLKYGTSFGDTHLGAVGRARRVTP